MDYGWRCAWGGEVVEGRRTLNRLQPLLHHLMAPTTHAPSTKQHRSTCKPCAPMDRAQYRIAASLTCRLASACPTKDAAVAAHTATLSGQSDFFFCGFSSHSRCSCCKLRHLCTSLWPLSLAHLRHTANVSICQINLVSPLVGCHRAKRSSQHAHYTGKMNFRYVLVTLCCQVVTGAIG